MAIVEAQCFRCDKCNKAYMEKEAAEKCCAPKICEYCGAEMPPKYYYTACDFCREKRRYDNADKMSLAEYVDADPHLPVFTKTGELIMPDDMWVFDDWKSHSDDKRPEYVYGAISRFVKLDAEGIIENLNEQVTFEEDDVEMFSDDALDEIWGFCANWNDRNEYEYYDENWKLVVIIPAEKENES